MRKYYLFLAIISIFICCAKPKDINKDTIIKSNIINCEMTQINNNTTWNDSDLISYKYEYKNNEYWETLLFSRNGHVTASLCNKVNNEWECTAPLYKWNIDSSNVLIIHEDISGKPWKRKLQKISITDSIVKVCSDGILLTYIRSRNK
jgi:hypothetical protein